MSIVALRQLDMPRSGLNMAARTRCLDMRRNFRRVVVGDIESPPQSATSCRQLPITTGSHGVAWCLLMAEHVISTGERPGVRSGEISPATLQIHLYRTMSPHRQRCLDYARTCLVLTQQLWRAARHDKRGKCLPPRKSPEASHKNSLRLWWSCGDLCLERTRTENSGCPLFCRR